MNITPLESLGMFLFIVVVTYVLWYVIGVLRAFFHLLNVMRRGWVNSGKEIKAEKEKKLKRDKFISRG